MESLKKTFDISQKEVHCIYVHLVNGIPQKEFAISQKEVLCIYVLLLNRIPQKEFDIRIIYTLYMYNF